MTIGCFNMDAVLRRAAALVLVLGGMAAAAPATTWGAELPLAPVDVSPGVALTIDRARDGAAVFRTDGTPQGTTKLAQLCPTQRACREPDQLWMLGARPVLTWTSAGSAKRGVSAIDPNTGALRDLWTEQSGYARPTVGQLAGGGVWIPTRPVPEAAFLDRYNADMQRTATLGPFFGEPRVVAPLGATGAIVEVASTPRATLVAAQQDTQPTVLASLASGDLSTGLVATAEAAVWCMGRSADGRRLPLLTDGTAAGTRSVGAPLPAGVDASDVVSTVARDHSWYIAYRTHLNGHGAVWVAQDDGSSGTVVFPRDPGALGVIPSEHGALVDSEQGVFALQGLSAPVLLTSTGGGPPEWRAPNTVVGGVTYWARGALELWRSDGTPAGTTRIERLANGPGAKGVYDPTVTWIAASAGHVFYNASAFGGDSRVLWSTEGTAGGARHVPAFGAYDWAPLWLREQPQVNVVRRGRRFVAAVTGRVSMPAETVNAAGSCRGRVGVALQRASGRGHSRQLTLRWNAAAACQYTGRVGAPAGGRGRWLWLSVESEDGAFPGGGADVGRRVKGPRR